MKYIVTMLLLASCATSQQMSSRYCIVVNEVRYNKHTASIKTKNSDYWYRYPNKNIHVGDTVDVSLNQIIEPRF